MHDAITQFFICILFSFHKPTPFHFKKHTSVQKFVFKIDNFLLLYIFNFYLDFILFLLALK